MKPKAPATKSGRQRAMSAALWRRMSRPVVAASTATTITQRRHVIAIGDTSPTAIRPAIAFAPQASPENVSSR